MTKEKCEWCGSDMKISKRGNLYCTNICWEKEEYIKMREENRDNLLEAAANYDAENYGDR